MGFYDRKKGKREGLGWGRDTLDNLLQLPVALTIKLDEDEYSSI